MFDSRSDVFSQANEKAENALSFSNSGSFLLKFLKTHEVCDKLVCTTCGGILFLLVRLEKHLNELGVDQVVALCEIMPNDFVEINNWKTLLEFWIKGIPNDVLNTVIFDAWKKKAGNNAEFDFFVMQHVMPNGFLKTSEGVKWLNQVLFAPIHAKKPILDYLRNFPEIMQLPVLLECQQTIQDAEPSISASPLDEWKDWQLKYPSQAMSLQKQNDEKLQTQVRYQKRKEERRNAELEQAEKIRVAILAQFETLNGLPHYERLKKIIFDKSLILDTSIRDLFNFDLMELAGLSSVELTVLMNGISSRLIELKENRYKYFWQDLRSRLSILRQSVMQQEFKQKHK